MVCAVTILSNYRLYNMNKYILCITAFLFYEGAIAQSKPAPLTDSVKNYLDSTFSIIEKNALNKNKVNWPLLKQAVFEKAAGATTYEDILPLYPYIFEQLDDHHGMLKFKNKSYYWKGNDAPAPNKILEQAITRYKEPIAQTIGKDIGYILIPGNDDFSNKRIDSITSSIKKEIAKVSGKNIKGWIIDLRNNTGGNMYPMLAGLSKLIGDGKAGSFVSAKGVSSGSWSIKNGALFYETTRVSAVENEGYPVPLNIPIVVLIGPYTASSGEMTAISVKGRKNSILIGEPSAGYTTVNTGFRLNSYSGLNLAIDYAADRNDHLYPKRITPDIMVKEGDNFENLNEDLKIKQALLWLKKHRL